MKRWRYGTPTPDHAPRYVDITGQRFGRLTVEARTGGMWACVCDCGERTIARTGDLRRGTAKSCGNSTHWRTDQPTYSAVHARLRSDLGSASQHACADCSGNAMHWSYDRTDPDELVQNGIPYSADPERYQPRCVPCHKAFDLAAIGALRATG